MHDIDRLIEAWEIFRGSNPYEICDGKEFRAIKEPEYCMGQMIEDTIVLLKEQEAVKPIPLSNRRYACGSCGNSLWVSGQRFCASCGKAVKWA